MELQSGIARAGCAAIIYSQHPFGIRTRTHNPPVFHRAHVFFSIYPAQCFGFPGSDRSAANPVHGSRRNQSASMCCRCTYIRPSSLRSREYAFGKDAGPGALNAIIEFPENFCPLCIVHFPFSFSPAAALSGRGSRILSFVHWEGIERLPAPERRPFRHRPEKHAYPATAQRSILHHMRFFVMPKYVAAVPGGHVKKRNRQRRDPLKPLFLCLRIRKKQPSLSRRLFAVIPLQNRSI